MITDRKILKIIRVFMMGIFFKMSITKSGVIGKI